MNTDTTVSLDNFILFDTPHSSCDNSDYIGSPRVRTFTSKFLLGANKLYERYNGLWVLKSVLVDDKLVTDYSLEAIDILEEQIIILSAFDKVVAIQFETLWEYFKFPNVAELNEISKQLTDRKLEGYHNPLKETYYTLLDDGKTVLSFEDWEVEMNTLHTKWLFCERLRLTDDGYDNDVIEGYLSNRTFKEFLKKFYDDGIQFYSKEVGEELPITEITITQAQVDYTNSIEEIRLSTGLTERHQLNQIALPLSEYIDLMLRMTHTRLNTNAVIHHATVIHNYHHPVTEDEVLVTATVRSDSEYTEARDLLLANSVITLSDLNPSPTESLADYIESLEREVELPYTDILHYGTIVYNYNRGTVVEQPFVPVFEDLTDEVMTEEEMYQDALQVITDTSGLETNEFLPLSTSSLNDYLDWIRDITDLPEDGVVGYGTIVYNYHNQYVTVENLAEEVTESGQIDHPF